MTNIPRTANTNMVFIILITDSSFFRQIINSTLSDLKNRANKNARLDDAFPEM
jgi:hypothetical protein